MKKIIVIITLFLFMQSCSTIHYRFDNNPNGDGEKKWHHHALFSLVEVSDPVRVKRSCDSGVHEITSRRNALQAIWSAIPWLGWAWSPSEVQIECSDKVAKNQLKGNLDSENNNTSSNTNTININISPEMMKKKKRSKKKKTKKRN